MRTKSRLAATAGARVVSWTARIVLVGVRGGRQDKLLFTPEGIYGLYFLGTDVQTRTISQKILG